MFAWYSLLSIHYVKSFQSWLSYRENVIAVTNWLFLSSPSSCFSHYNIIPPLTPHLFPLAAHLSDARTSTVFPIKQETILPRGHAHWLDPSGRSLSLRRGSRIPKVSDDCLSRSHAFVKLSHWLTMRQIVVIHSVNREETFTPFFHENGNINAPHECWPINKCTRATTEIF